MNNTVVLLTAWFIVVPPVSAFAQTAMLPQDDPRLSAQDAQQREELRDSGTVIDLHRMDQCEARRNHLLSRIS